jgi:hypothetical protein
MTPAEFVEALNKAPGHEKYAYALDPQGPKYQRVTQVFLPSGSDSRSCYCFLDKDGNIYKPAGWKAPAKGARGNLATFYVAQADPFGRWLYR